MGGYDVMENRNIIIILLVIIVVLAAAIGVMLLNPTNAKEPVKVKIISDTKQYEDDGEVSIKLTDSNGTAISKEVVNITVTNSKGKVVVDDVVKTNSKGKAKLDLDLKKGKYVVNVTYGGNENYTGNNTTQKLTIKEKVVQTQSTTTTNRDTYVEREENGFKYGYKDGRYGFWTPSGNFIEDKSRALAGEDPMEPFMEDGSFTDQL